MNKDDGELVNNILSGDDTAFNVLVQKYQKSIHAIAWQRVGDFHVAEEITQDVFLQAYNKLPTLKDPNKFARWLYVIAKRRCTRWLQREKPTMLLSLDDTDEATLDKSAFEHYVAEQREEKAAEQYREIVENLLEKLPENQRTVVVLYYLREMTSEAISKFMGVSINTIKSRLRRARQRLREQEMITVECFEHDEFKGKKITILEDSQNLQDSLERSGFENRIQSIRIIQGGDIPSSGGKVVVYEDPDYRGAFLPIHVKPGISMIEIPNCPLSIHSIKIEG